MRVYLASTSPRRRDLLTQAAIAFDCVVPGPEPDDADTDDPGEIARRRARSKCLGAFVSPAAAAGMVLGVDTVVDLAGCELGKPVDRAAARAMLRRLAGREHAVHTAHCARWHPLGRGRARELLATARVRFATPSDADLEAYLDTGDWADKAGGYGIQGPAGRFCELVGGERDTVIGLSVSAVRALLRAFGST